MADAARMMERGLARRSTSETRMNAQSSRSHAVLTLHLESATRTDSGLLAVKSSRLNLVDLAGQPINPEEYCHPRVTVQAIKGAHSIGRKSLHQCTSANDKSSGAVRRFQSRSSVGASAAAGSERNKSSGAAGDRLREACSINQSLTTLGRVMKELVEAQRSRLARHIPYRDSRLTFLLQACPIHCSMHAFKT